LIIAAVAIWPSSAVGAKVHQFSLSFGSSGSGDGLVSLAESSGLAVNENSGNVYVADTGNHRVDEFDSSGAFIRAFGADVGGTGVDICAVGCVAGTSGTAPGEFVAPTFIAIDNSGGLSAGDVYVADTSDNLVTKFEADGTLVSSWGAGGQLNGSGAPNGPFGEIAGVAVDSAGALDVFEVEPHLLFKFDQAGAFSGEVETPRGTAPGGLAVNPTGNFFKVNGNFTVEKFEASGTDVGQVNVGETTTGLAVDDSTGDLFIDNGGSIDNYSFGPSGEVVGSGCLPAEFSGCAPTGNFGEGHLTAGAGLAVDGASHTVYSADRGANEIVAFALVTFPDVVTSAGSTVGVADATLTGTANPVEAPLTECFFEWGESEAYGEVAPCESPDAGEVGEGNAPVPVHAEVSGLEAGTAYHFRLVAANAAGSVKGEDEEFTTLGPRIAGETVSQITSTSAKVSGQVNPVGDDTTFFVEYVTEAQFIAGKYTEATTAPVTPRDIGSGTEFVPVAQQLGGLSPATTYHVRIVASNSIATSHGHDMTFTTFDQVVPGLPDERAYELVSPAQKLGEVFVPSPSAGLDGSCVNCLPGLSLIRMPMQSRPDGEAVAYEGQAFSEGVASGPNEYLGNRTSSGWGLQDLSSPAFANGRGSNEGYVGFSPDLSKSLIFQINPALSPDAPVGEEGNSFANLYLRTEDPSREPPISLEPVVVEEPPNRAASRFDPNAFKILYESANAGTPQSPSLTHVVFEANDALTGATANAPAAVDGGVVEPVGETRPINLNLYEWFEGGLRLVNVDPENTSTAPGAVLGSGHLLDPEPSAETSDIDHAISADGSRIFWSKEETGQVFVRINGEDTREIQDHGGTFLTASADGSKVLLSDGCLYDLEEEECEDLTLDEGGLHQGGFQGILGSSEDLSRIYFADTAVLTGENAEHKSPVEEAGKVNLYAWQEGAPTTFIGVLQESDDKIGVEKEFGAWKASSSDRTAQVSPDGRYLAFMSKARLTGYDNGRIGIGSGEGCGGPEGTECFEVFEYDAGSARLTCASCDPSGQRPLGQSNLNLIQSAFSFPQPGNLTPEGEGRLFFESQDALSNRDTNGEIQDVYEWEPSGVGSCARVGGCVSLISTGNAPNDSMFLDASDTGNDVFFVTRQQLLPRDKDDLLDLYDARAPHVAGEAVGFPEGETTPCAGEACSGPASSPPAQGSAGSLSFSGPENPPRPHKHKRHRKHKKHRHKHSPRHHRGGSK
jgi:hypothetical protein